MVPTRAPTPSRARLRQSSFNRRLTCVPDTDAREPAHHVSMYRNGDVGFHGGRQECSSDALVVSFSIHSCRAKPNSIQELDPVIVGPQVRKALGRLARVVDLEHCCFFFELNFNEDGSQPFPAFVCGHELDLHFPQQPSSQHVPMNETIGRQAAAAVNLPTVPLAIAKRAA